MRKIIRLATVKLGTQATAQLLTFFNPDGHLTVTQITLIRWPMPMYKLRRVFLLLFLQYLLFKRNFMLFWPRRMKYKISKIVSYGFFWVIVFYKLLSCRYMGIDIWNSNGFAGRFLEQYSDIVQLRLCFVDSDFVVSPQWQGRKEGWSSCGRRWKSL